MNPQSARPPTPPPPVPASYVADEQWVDQHMVDLVGRYPDEWIGVVNGRVAAHGKSSAQVRGEIEHQLPGSTPYVCLIEGHPRVYAG